MKRGLKIFIFILVVLFALFVSVINPEISRIKEDNKDFEYEKLGDIYVYDFVEETTYDNLREIVSLYNSEYGYSSENQILVGKGKNEFVFAEYDENCVSIYCEVATKNKTSNEKKVEQLTFLIETSLEIIGDDTSTFINGLSSFHGGLAESCLILSNMNAVFGNYHPLLPEPDMFITYNIMPIAAPILIVVDFVAVCLAITYCILFLLTLLFKKYRNNQAIKEYIKLLSKKQITLLLASVVFAVVSVIFKHGLCLLLVVKLMYFIGHLLAPVIEGYSILLS